MYLSLSVYVPQYECCLSWPVEISTSGVKRLIDLSLTPGDSADILKTVQSNLSDIKFSKAIIPP